MQTSFIPNSFNAPTYLKTNCFYFRVLDHSIAELDYEAVMSSQPRLQHIFGPHSQWPRSDMTIEQNITSLKVHKSEFETQKAFAYSIFNNTQDRCLGSVYIDPSQSPNYDCEVYFWIRDDSLTLENELYQTILKWLRDKWPFSTIALPGREISWQDWDKELSFLKQIKSE